MAIEKVAILSVSCTRKFKSSRNTNGFSLDLLKGGLIRLPISLKTRLGLLAKYITRHLCGYNHSEALSVYFLQCLSIPVSGAN